MGFDGFIKSGLDPNEFRKTFAEKIPALKKQTVKFFNEWLKQVTQ